MKPVNVRTASILIVDAQQADIQLLEYLLHDEGYTSVHSTSTPQDVCKLHRKHGFDLILLDLQLPAMDGFAVMAALAELADPSLCVIVLTAESAHTLRALQAGAKDFISKPLDLVEARIRIHNALEVRLLYKELRSYATELEQRVQERTAELQESEARFRGLTELASDWYWEQDAEGKFTKVSGPVQEMLGIAVDASSPAAGPHAGNGWNAAERSALQHKIAAHESFLDFAFSRTRPDGSRQDFRVSGQPLFDKACTFIGYRGVGVEIAAPEGSAQTGMQ